MAETGGFEDNGIRGLRMGDDITRTIIENQAALATKQDGTNRRLEQLRQMLEGMIEGKRPCALAITVARLNGKFKILLAILIPVVIYILTQIFTS
jgi:hypothetical protein